MHIVCMYIRLAFISPYMLDMYLHVSPYTLGSDSAAVGVYMSHTIDPFPCVPRECVLVSILFVCLQIANCFDFNVYISSYYSLILGVCDPPIYSAQAIFTSLHNINHVFFTVGDHNNS